MQQWTALVAGGTGLVGRSLAERLSVAGDVGMAVSLVRRNSGAKLPKFREFKTDFDRLRLLPDLRPRAAFCCLGTTIRTAGSQEAFRRVDHHYVLAFARAAREAGAETFCVVSSVGADAASGNFYLSTKGEMERDLEALGFPALHVMRPSLLLGKRTEKRPAERLGMLGGRLVAPLLLGTLRRYRPIQADTVAAALLAAARLPPAGTQAHEYDAIRALAAGA